ncbi:MAG: ABC transporter substrate-binding protein [Chitinophagales bacterium]|jgi:peptide/nickel transport system substrate-binding protein|nr:ABC transporter substrate-binding protein [Chitinophagales bacterium]
MKLNYAFVLVISLFCFNFSCKDASNAKENEIKVHLLADPDLLNPYLSKSADATNIEELIFQKLIKFDLEAGQFVPVLAKSKPVITTLPNGKMKLEFEIRDSAIWDDGKPITGYDVAFSYKAVLNPKCNTEHIKPYFEFLENVLVDSLNPKKFSVIAKKKYILVEEYSGYFVLPRHIFDPKGLMDKISFDALTNPIEIEKLKTNSDALTFAKEFNSELYSRDAKNLKGSGPYELKEWKTQQKVILTKKKNWWGHQYLDSSLANYAYVDLIEYQIMNDWNTAKVSMKSGSLDCIKSIEFKVFDDLKKEEKFNANYNIHTPIAPQYVYIGLNQNNAILKELAVRKALSHCLDRDLIISTLLYGLGVKVNSMVNPNKDYYNKNIQSLPYNLELAKKALAEAGWKDSDGDGILDKVLEGKLTKLSLDYKYNSGNETRKNIGLIYKENLKKVGIELNLSVKEWVKFLDELKAHEFDIYCGSWVGDPNVEDPTQIWHTSSAKGGSNYVSYGDATSDKLIEEIRGELDEDKRKSLYMAFQQKVNEDIPYLFIYAPLERLAFHKRFTNAKAFTERPGYDLGRWKLSSQ